MVRKTLIIGGARSGKSSRAETLAKEWDEGKKIYIATYQSQLNKDTEMNERIRRHQERRGPEWTTFEVGSDLPNFLKGHSHEGNGVLLDCATMWLAGLFEKDQRTIEELCENLEESVRHFAGQLIVVGNEVGQSLVPETATNRLFRDMNGFLNQALARAVDRVELVVAGLPMVLK